MKILSPALAARAAEVQTAESTSNVEPGIFNFTIAKVEDGKKQRGDLAIYFAVENKNDKGTVKKIFRFGDRDPAKVDSDLGDLKSLCRSLGYSEDDLTDLDTDTLIGQCGQCGVEDAHYNDGGSFSVIARGAWWSADTSLKHIEWQPRMPQRRGGGFGR